MSCIKFCDVHSVLDSSCCLEGQLKLRVYVNHGLVTVHVLEARHLTSPSGSLCHSFVQVSVLPSTLKVPECQTKMVHNTDSPVYDEIFSVESDELKKKKRLVVSVWHRETTSSENTFLGCMSFGMKHLLGVYSSAKKGLSGWYHLLTDNVGRRKHLRLSTLGSKRQAAAELPALKEVTEVNKDVLWMEAVTIVITRGQGGFAFSIAGNNPVRVSRVDMGSQADIAGLKSGDYIVRINGQNISRSTANSVAKIVRHSPEQIVLDIQRPYGSKVIPRSLSSASSSENESDKENCTPIQHLHVPLPWQRLSDNGALSWQPNREESSWQQDEKRGSVCSSLEEMKMTRTEDVMEVSSSTDTSLPSSNDKWSLGSTAELQCDFAHQRVLACESKFVEVMQSGIQRYSRPLRHRVISHSEHATLFQNVEKLVAISEFLVRSLQAQSHQTVGSDGLDCEAGHMDLGNMYQSKVSMMTAAYRAYCDGLSGAMPLLAELQTSSKFDNFLQEQPLQYGQPTISEFICKPLEHLCDLVFNLQSVMTSDPSSVSLQHVVAVLRNCCNQISETIGKHTSSSHSLVSRSAKVSRSSLMSGSSLMSRSLMLSVSSSQLTGSSLLQSSAKRVDVEINNLLGRLVFPRHLQRFWLSGHTRHIIYSGELLLDTRPRVKVWAVLMSDLLLLTRPDTHDRLVVTEDPIMLQDVISHDFTRQHPSEFILAVASCHGDRHVREMRLLTFCAPNIEEKTTWCNILIQRVSTQRLISRNSVDSFL